MANELVKTEVQKLGAMLGSEAVKNRFNEILGKKSAGFISSVLSVVKNNKMFEKVDAGSVLNSAAIAASLDLPVNPNLGFSALIPYGNQCQFQIMTKGLTELCLRSGQVKNIVNEIVYEGQLVKKNKFTGEYEFDEDGKTSDKVIGYMAHVSLVNGFAKTMYMTVDEVKAHAQKFSQTYRKGYGVWRDSFDSMALKSVLKLLLSKYIPKSISYQLQQAVTYDQAVVNGSFVDGGIETLEASYEDNKNPQSARKEMMSDLVNDAEDAEVVDG